MSSAAKSPSVKFQPARVLLVEDNPLNQKLLGFMLKNRGIGCDVCANGQLAIEQVQQQTYNLVLMDVEMPVLNGYEATRAIRTSFGTTLPVVGLTAHTSQEEIEKCMQAGMVDCLSKPVQESKLQEVLQKYLKQESNA